MTKKPKHLNENYDLIALDMDGALLDSNKKVDEHAISEIQKASEKGKIVVLTTGRCLAEIAPYEELMDNIHYGILESGAVLYDFKEKKILKNSGPGINKGKGLLQLCQILDIPVSRTAAVGDSSNDETILQACGFPIAMGNAKGFIKGISKYVVSDNDNHGCAEAIRMVS